jgi:hypothetical protein
MRRQYHVFHGDNIVGSWVRLSFKNIQQLGDFFDLASINASSSTTSPLSIDQKP